ncbi:unnamed protein product [Rotaria sordida]|uniref:NAD(+)--protein-arginine ADP-ribosyltransferase n=1 Tax=Rotaria sordida TaxID=392033 RepID=A0A815C0H6_9BILA|nr:unnamed protein product [Rotaria sordida]CAF1558079.1 unnamed protein product [Rotaria sordida]
MMNRFGDIEVSFKRLPPVYGYRSAELVSIEKALEPIQPQIDELPYYIKIAKRNCHFPSEHGLSRDQSAAVYIYTMEWGDTTLYRVLNKALRSENRQALKIWFPYLKLFAVSGKKISGYTEYESENEVILRMGSQFRVKSDPLEQSNGSHLVHLIEIDDNDDQPLASAMNDMHLAAAKLPIKTSSGKLFILFLKKITFCMIHIYETMEKCLNTD